MSVFYNATPTIVQVRVFPYLVGRPSDTSLSKLRDIACENGGTINVNINTIFAQLLAMVSIQWEGLVIEGDYYSRSIFPSLVKCSSYSVYSKCSH